MQEETRIEQHRRSALLAKSLRDDGHYVLSDAYENGFFTVLTFEDASGDTQRLTIKTALWKPLRASSSTLTLQYTAGWLRRQWLR